MPKEKVFTEGDLVFAKVKGYSPWPARVEDCIQHPKNARYKVFFYGTYQTAVCKAESIFSFEESKEKYGNTPKKGDKNFNRAMNEILCHPHIRAICKKNKPQSSLQKDNYKDFEVEENHDRDGEEEEEEDDDDDEKKTFNTSIKTKIRSTRTSSLCGSLEPKAKKAKTETMKTKAAVANSKTSDMSDKEKKENGANSEFVAPNSATKEEKTTKTKSDDLFGEPKAKKAKTETMKTKAAVANSKTSDMSDKEKKENGANSEFVAPNSATKEEKTTKTKSDDLFGVESCISMKMPRMEALSIFDSKNVTKNCYVKPNFASRSSSLTFMKAELKIISINRELQKLFAPDKVGDPQAGLVLLDRLQAVQIQPLMIKKQPSIARTISLLCHYVGCVKKWHLEKEDEDIFVSNASKLRAKSCEILNFIKSLFSLPEKTNFLAWLVGEANRLRAAAASPEMFITMTQEPTVVELKSNE